MNSQSIQKSNFNEDKLQIDPYATSVVNFIEFPIENKKKSGIFSSFIPLKSNDAMSNK